MANGEPGWIDFKRWANLVVRWTQHCFPTQAFLTPSPPDNRSDYDDVDDDDDDVVDDNDYLYHDDDYGVYSAFLRPSGPGNDARNAW